MKKKERKKDVKRRLYNLNTEGSPEKSNNPLHEKSLPDLDSKIIQGNNIIMRYTRTTILPNLIPVPFIDIPINSTINVVMLREIASLFNKTFSTQQVKIITTSIINTMGTHFFISGTVNHILKYIPLVGGVASFFAVPSISVGSTYAIGKVFLMHFSEGGAIVNFDIKDFDDYFLEMFEEGKTLFSLKHT
jgi:uncharacterized protein (DUF697 family)